MAAFFVDLDGTCLKYHTNEWLPGVVEALGALVDAGHQIHFITMTGPQDAGEVYCEEARRELIAQLPFKCTLTTAVPSPRLLIDDSSIGTLRADHDSPLSWILAAMEFAKLLKR